MKENKVDSSRVTKATRVVAAFCVLAFAFAVIRVVGSDAKEELSRSLLSPRMGFSLLLVVVGFPLALYIVVTGRVPWRIVGALPVPVSSKFAATKREFIYKVIMWVVVGVGLVIMLGGILYMMGSIDELRELGRKQKTVSNQGMHLTLAYARASDSRR